MTDHAPGPDDDNLPEPVSRVVVVKTTFAGYHHWPGASGERAYLGHQHRHLFHVEVALGVAHDDREVEFHDLLQCLTHAVGWLDSEHTGVQMPLELGASSCEDIATELARLIRVDFPGRHMSVSVFEDDEVGAVLTWKG